jgi:hypothetical protein
MLHDSRLPLPTRSDHRHQAGGAALHGLIKQRQLGIPPEKT